MITSEHFSLFDNLSEPIILFGKSSVCYYNPAFLTFSKTKPRLLKKVNCISDIFNFENYNIQEKIDEALSSNQTVKTEEIKISPVGAGFAYTVSTIITPLKLAEDMSLIISFKDYSEEVNLQEKYKSNVAALKETHELLIHEHKLMLMGEMAAEMAHEINNPLAIIQGNLELLQFSLVKQNIDESQKLNLLLDAVLRIEKIVKGLKNFSRGENDDYAIVNISEVVKETVSLFQSITKDDYEVECLTSEDEISLVGDSHKIQQVLTNLLTNAKDSLEGMDIKRITISLSKDKHNIYLKVKDTGCGIPEENKDKIFEGFFTTKEVGKGTGLGMGVISSIVKNMNGKVKLESEVSKGTTFTLTFPTFNVQESSMFESNILKNDEVPVPQLKNILVVDDEVELLKILTEYLNETNANIKISETVKKAEEIIQAEKFDLIITDFKIKEESGFNLAMTVKTCEKNKETPLILSTGSLSEDLKKDYRLELSLFNGTIEKPYKKLQLFKIINSALGN